MLDVNRMSVGYAKKQIIKDVSFTANKGEIVSIIGPNGSGKSTLLKAVSNFIPYEAGTVIIEGDHLSSLKQKQIAKKMCMVSQKNEAPHDMTVEALVSYGRHPHKKWFEKLNQDDMSVVQWAIERTYLKGYEERTVSSLSGGEAQRAWIAMALAQEPKILLLDEPTTYLDISHQHEILELVKELNEDMKMTIVMVLHDLNQAARYSDQIIVIKAGRRVTCGSPQCVMTEDMIRDVYKMDAEIEYVAQEIGPRIHLLCSSKGEEEKSCSLINEVSQIHTLSIQEEKVR